MPECGPEALEALTAWSWPGNVRELQNTLQRAVIVCAADRILPHHLGLQASGWGREGASALESGTLDYGEAKEQAIARFQREFLVRALERSRGNVSQAAEHCGLTRAALQRIMRSQGIDREAFRAGSPPRLARRRPRGPQVVGEGLPASSSGPGFETTATPFSSTARTTTGDLLPAPRMGVKTKPRAGIPG